MSISKVYEEFLQYFQKEDKERSVNFLMQLLSHGELSVVDCYTKILTPALYAIAGNTKKQEITISQEHIRTGIARTIVECCYPYVIAERNMNYCIPEKERKKIIVLCPEEEYHEIGPRMVADFFTLHHYNTIFVGGNTPREDFAKILSSIQPDYVAISVSNYYNLVVAKRMIERVKKELDKKAKIIVGGYAVISKQVKKEELGADYLFSSYDDIKMLSKEDYKDVCS